MTKYSPLCIISPWHYILLLNCYTFIKFLTLLKRKINNKSYDSTFNESNILNFMTNYFNIKQLSLYSVLSDGKYILSTQVHIMKQQYKIVLMTLKNRPSTTCFHHWFCILCILSEKFVLLNLQLTCIYPLSCLRVAETMVWCTSTCKYFPWQYSITPNITERSILACKCYIIFLVNVISKNTMLKAVKYVPKFKASGAVHFIGICFIPSDTIYSSSSRDIPKSDIFTIFSLPFNKKLIT